jgi:glycosyltransferase involved in cell wall biosynthesis
MASPSVLPDLAVIAIGRNEGERLHDCLDSVRSRAALVVYVDSGSSDDSVNAALARGAVVVNLDMSMPFTAARARNEGFRRVRELAPQIQWVQFVDGDCKVASGWLEEALAFLQARPEIAAVAGRRSERFPERSVYNWLCDLDWNQPPGAVRDFGGDVLIRVAALEQVGGYRDDLIAGEEPELCVRLRAKGWKIWRLGSEMTEHDAAMTRFSQWWKRSTRTGFAFAEGAHLHGAPPERHWVRETRSGWFWGAGIPAAVLVGTGFVGPMALLGLAVYPAQVIRLSTPNYGSWPRSVVHAFFIVLGKFPQVLGQLKFVVLQLLGRKSKIIEYK